MQAYLYISKQAVGWGRQGGGAGRVGICCLVTTSKAWSPWQLRCCHETLPVTQEINSQEPYNG